LKHILARKSGASATENALILAITDGGIVTVAIAFMGLISNSMNCFRQCHSQTPTDFKASAWLTASTAEARSLKAIALPGSQGRTMEMSV